MNVTSFGQATDKELETFYGKTKNTSIAKEMREIFTKTIRIVPAKNLSLDCITYKNGIPKLSSYPVLDIAADYSGEVRPNAALALVLEKSDCPFVAAYREALVSKYIENNADSVIDFLGEEE